MVLRARAWLIVLIGGLAAVVAGMALGGSFQLLVAMVCGLGPAITAQVAVTRQPQATKLPWRFFVWAGAGFWLSSILRQVLVELGVSNSFPSPADATVVEVSDRFRGEPRYGKAVVLKLDDGTTVWITHLDGYSVKAGDRLSAGDVFATVGKTQFMKTPHVHIEAYRQTGVDRRVDPGSVWPFLARS